MDFLVSTGTGRLAHPVIQKAKSTELVEGASRTLLPIIYMEYSVFLLQECWRETTGKCRESSLQTSGLSYTQIICIPECFRYRRLNSIMSVFFETSWLGGY